MKVIALGRIRGMAGREEDELGVEPERKGLEGFGAAAVGLGVGGCGRLASCLCRGSSSCS